MQYIIIAVLALIVLYDLFKAYIQNNESKKMN